MMHESYIVIGTWERGEARAITLQDFVVNGESFIPIFSDEDTFKAETKGSGFAGNGVAIDRQFLWSLLRGNELLILNPGSDNPIRLRPEDLLEEADAAYLNMSRQQFLDLHNSTGLYRPELPTSNRNLKLEDSSKVLLRF